MTATIVTSVSSPRKTSSYVLQSAVHLRKSAPTESVSDRSLVPIAEDRTCVSTSLPSRQSCRVFRGLGVDESARTLVRNGRRRLC